MHRIMRERFDEQPAPPARNMEAIHDDGEPLIELASPGPGLIDAEVEARIEIEQDPAQPRRPTVFALVVVKEIAHSYLSRHVSLAARDRAGETDSSRLGPCLSRSDWAGLWRNSHKVNGKDRIGPWVPRIYGR